MTSHAGARGGSHRAEGCEDLDVALELPLGGEEPSQARPKWVEKALLRAALRAQAGRFQPRTCRAHASQHVRRRRKHTSKHNNQNKY